ncbi:hypothetical protein GBA65_11055 [Rubrobacter marinus]|uniref:Uncharacterized protein n=1 Tax=Rubrobacter marinus TaxID=2653852 RepID=A0A6G8PXM2_9ACTN|nr:endolytic transglycosylase MltG [Rubrobacter marinus]QIN78971.1 hypothetical protein GBA65_11055 [Rubrobacter marinus]
MIASVIYNRIRAGMPCRSTPPCSTPWGSPRRTSRSPTSRWRAPTTPTRTPVCRPAHRQPSRDSLVAALEPAETDYLYYVLEADGRKHFFTNDYDEFLAAKSEAGR